MRLDLLEDPLDDLRISRGDVVPLRRIVLEMKVSPAGTSTCAQVPKRSYPDVSCSVHAASVRATTASGRPGRMRDIARTG
jgi:hypothetical protein